jgi:MoxR-like ATPase
METETHKDLLLVDALNDVLQHLKKVFVGKDDIIDLMGICLVGRENMFLIGPPGTAKSAIVRELAALLEGKNFEYLLTRFTEPNEIFGPFDIRKLRDGDLVTNTDGMLPEASLVFLDELFNANSAILNSLLMALNEKIFKRGKETKSLPALMFVGASNQLPEDEALQALFDRFLIRVRCDYVDPKYLSEVLNAGWKLEEKRSVHAPKINADDIRKLQSHTSSVNLTDIQPSYIELIQKLRNAGIKVSDRRAVKLQRLIAASALLCKRKKAFVSDMWILKYIWDTEEQQEVITGIVNAVISSDLETKDLHPRASLQSAPNADDLYREVVAMIDQWEDTELPMSEKTALKDRLRYLNGRCEWISNEEQRNYVQTKMDELWQKMMEVN